MSKITVIHGPNLNLLGKRSKDIYGKLTLTQINKKIETFAKEKGVDVSIFQSNSESAILETIHAAAGSDGLVINPAAFTHNSYAIRSAIIATGIDAVEVHISNVHAREPFMKESVIAPVCRGQITGLGWYGYVLAIDYLRFLKEDL